MRRTTARLTTCCVALVAALVGLSMASQPAAQDAEPLTLAYNASGLELLQRLAAEPGNIVLSPYSIGSAMAMARAGARGATDTEMASVLRHRLDRAGTDAANARLLKIFKGYESAGARLLVANALLHQESAVSADYRRLLEASYGAEVLAGVGLEQVNAWVSSKTEGKIPRMLDQLNGDAVAVLLNAIYFKAQWAQPFSARATRDDAFHLTAERRIDVPMMRQTGGYEIVSLPGYRAIRLPYDVASLSMIVVLPDQTDGLAELARRFDGRELSTLTAALDAVSPRQVALALPRFKASFKADLKGHFSQLGMQAAFDPQQADFSGITGRPAAQGGLAIGRIVHRAVIDVTEEGTEAAAATAVEMRETARYHPEQPERLVVDHPFLFLIVDRASAAVLFAGRIADPR